MAPRPALGLPGAHDPLSEDRTIPNEINLLQHLVALAEELPRDPATERIVLDRLPAALQGDRSGGTAGVERRLPAEWNSAR